MPGENRGMLAKEPSCPLRHHHGTTIHSSKESAPERGAAQPTLIEARKTSLIGLPVKIWSRDYVA